MVKIKTDEALSVKQSRGQVMGCYATVTAIQTRNWKYEHYDYAPYVIAVYSPWLV